MPLRFHAGLRICESLNVNQLWLANGHGNPWPYVPVRLERFASVANERSLFSEVFSTHVNPVSSAASEQFETQPGMAAPDPGWTWEAAVGALVSHFVSVVPSEAKHDFLAYLSEAANEFVKNQNVIDSSPSLQLDPRMK